MKKPTQAPTYWELLKVLLDDLKSRRALDEHGDHLILRVEEDKRQLVRYFEPRNKARFEYDLDKLVWRLQSDDRMWDWLTRRGGHYDYLRNDRLIETPREIYLAYCRKYHIDIPDPRQLQLDFGE